MKFSSILGLGALLASSPVYAHYRFYKLIANGVLHDEFKYIRPYEAPYYNGPTQDVTSTDIRCHMKARPAADVLTVQAGSDIGFQVDGAIVHPGPFTAYLARAPSDASLTTWSGDGDWFKIWEQGALVSSSPDPVVWDEGVNTKWMFKIPKNVPSGKYLLRFEHIALHGAWEKAGAQFYISCAQLDIVNGSSGGVSPGPTIKFPGGYTDADPGIFINIFWPAPYDYKIPGPPVWTGA